MAQSNQCSTKILVVDDEPIAREIFSAILEQDYSIATADTGESALALVSSFGPDVIVLDAVMPGLDGWEVCRRYKQNTAGQGAKIIMVSAKAVDAEQKWLGYESGADDYLAKPFIHEELLAKVQVWARLKKTEDQLRAKIRQLETEKLGLERSNAILGSKLDAKVMLCPRCSTPLVRD